MANKECTACIHKAVCKTAESCDGYVPGCKHFKEEKRGRWINVTHREYLGYYCSKCQKWFCEEYNYCPNCGADMKGK